MPERVARGRWESSRPNIQGFQGEADLPWVSRGLRRGRKAYPMENRYRFLYPVWTELRGRMHGARAGNGKTGASAGGRGQERPPAGGRRREAERNEVAKRAWCVPGKAAIAPYGPVPQTDTGGWGENPKAGGRSIAKELGKMTP